MSWYILHTNDIMKMSLQYMYLIILALNVFLLELNQCCSEYRTPPNEFNFLLAINISLDCDMVPGIWYNSFTHRKYNAIYNTNTSSDALVLHTPSLFFVPEGGTSTTRCVNSLVTTKACLSRCAQITLYAKNLLSSVWQEGFNTSWAGLKQKCSLKIYHKVYMRNLQHFWVMTLMNWVKVMT